MKTDIVIIGCGGASLLAALIAYKKGSNVLVLEKCGIVGDNALIAEGDVEIKAKSHEFRSYCG